MLFHKRLTSIISQQRSEWQVKDERYAFILISDEKRWNNLCERDRSNKGKHVFIRKNFAGPISTRKLLFYVKRPIMQIRGVADFVERFKGDPLELWKKLGSESCFGSFAEYCAFVDGREKVTFVRFENFRELENPVSAEVFSSSVGIALAPRGGRYLSYDQANRLPIWASSLSRSH